MATLAWWAILAWVQIDFTLTEKGTWHCSSTNAKKWETELQTLKNNNARLTAALQESTANVEEWKKQLNAYKEENIKLRKKVLNKIN